MKKIVLSIVAVIAISSASFAQVKIGAKGGLNLANVGGDAEDTDIRPSIHFGGYVNFALSEQFSIQPELLYNSVGYKIKQSESSQGYSYTSDGTYRLNYISIPIIAQYSFGNFYLQAGPQVSFLASAKAEGESTETYQGITETFSGEVDVKDQYKGTDLGFNLGLGANFGKLNATVRYSAGLSNIYDSDDDDDYKETNNVIQLSIGYTLFGGE